RALHEVEVLLPRGEIGVVSLANLADDFRRLRGTHARRATGHALDVGEIPRSRLEQRESDHRDDDDRHSNPDQSHDYESGQSAPPGIRGIPPGCLRDTARGTRAAMMGCAETECRHIPRDLTLGECLVIEVQPALDVVDLTNLGLL